MKDHHIMKNKSKEYHYAVCSEEFVKIRQIETSKQGVLAILQSINLFS